MEFNSVLLTERWKNVQLVKFLKKNVVGYFFLTPWIIGLLVFTMIPMVTSLYLSFTDYNLFTSPDWVGLQNYVHMFQNDSTFAASIKVTFTYVFISVPLELSFALLIAIILNKGMSGLRFYRAVYYIPSLFGGSVAIALLWRQVFGLEGIFNQFLKLFGIQGVSWIGNPDYALYTLVVLNVWQFGAAMIIFLAGLKMIPNDLYEAASIDGAGRWTRFAKITMPILTPVILFNSIMQTISAFKSFTPSYVISDGSGGPADSLMFYTLYLYHKAFQYYQMGYASALAWVLLLIIALFTALIFLSSKKWAHYEE
jgi:multiple sugar transport system permease protein